MKKCVKQLGAVMMALVLLAGLVFWETPALAAELTTTIRVTGIEADCNVYAYAIAIDATDANGNHYWKYNAAGSVESRVKDGSISPEDLIYFYMNLNTKTGPDDWNVHDGDGEAVVDNTVLAMTYSSADGSYSVSGVKPGLYVIAANKEVKEYSYSGNVVAVNYQYSGTGIASIADENGVINVAVKKASDPTLKKEVLENGQTFKYGDANIGDSVDFQITMTIPSYEGSWKSDQLHYIITDTLSEGLTLDQGSVKVEGTAITEKFGTGKLCTATTITTSDNGFTLNLFGEDVYQYAGATILLTYSATVNGAAKVNFDEEENKATLRYSTVAGGTDLSDVVTDITYHYTFGFDTLVNGSGSETTTEITKLGIRTTTETDNKVPLDGAQFQLYNADNELLHFTEDGRFTTDATANGYITSKNSGRLTAMGLDAGTYTLRESKAPYGYALDKTVYTVTITPTYNELTGELQNYTVTVGGGASNSITFTHEKLDNGTINSTDNAANADTFGIINTPLLTLPETGGVGVIVVTVLAVMLMAGFGSMFILLKKKGNAE